jgi:hypothetical protein
MPALKLATSLFGNQSPFSGVPQFNSKAVLT